MFSIADHRHMARALELAHRGLYSCAPNPRVGCVLVNAGSVVGEGFHARTGEAHAEAAALAQAGSRARGATAYVTLEPCHHTGRTPPCSAALIDAGIGEVVVAMEDPDPRVRGAGLADLEAAGIPTRSGLMSGAAQALNAGFISRMIRGRPFLRAKVAMSLDARTAMASGESQWITGPAARRDVQHWRASSGAIITGVGTVLADDPKLTVRAGELRAGPRFAAPATQPLRVILDSRWRTPTTAAVLGGDGEALVIGSARHGDAGTSLSSITCTLPVDQPRPDLADTLRLLARRGINDVLLEAGRLLTGAFAAARLIDEYVIYTAPTLLGSDARGMLDLPGLDTMAQQQRLSILDTRRVGEDLRLILRPADAP